MTHKVLLADDSLTIQKVIKITLANEPYILLDCRSEVDLMNVIERESPHLVLLDFSLSENKSGYELCKIIRSKKPGTSVLMMYGTFDTIDENALKNCGAQAKIIKPFDSGKFINLCKTLIQEVDSSNSSVETSAPTEEVFTPSKGEELSWVMDAPSKPENSEMPVVHKDIDHNLLEEEMQAWGMPIPSKISGGGEIVNFPPKIQSQVTNIQAIKIQELHEEELRLPESGDLEYPDMTLVHTAPQVVNKIEKEIEKVEDDITLAGPLSKLVPLSQLKPIQNNEFSFDESTGSYEIKLEDEGTTSEEDIRKLEEQISDEIEHTVSHHEETQSEVKTDGMSLSAFQDLWTADEIESLNPTIKSIKPKEIQKIVESKVELEIDHHDQNLESHSKVIKEVTDDLNQLNLGADFEAQVKAAVRPIIEQMVQEYCKKTLEKVAWEVIPDLAENIIKKELQRISDSIIGE
jgi:DNA-binding response OmpR family regulator